jgi:hypothetical protein
VGRGEVQFVVTLPEKTERCAEVSIHNSGTLNARQLYSCLVLQSVAMPISPDQVNPGTGNGYNGTLPFYYSGEFSKNV